MQPQAEQGLLCADAVLVSQRHRLAYGHSTLMMCADAQDPLALLNTQQLSDASDRAENTHAGGESERKKPQNRPHAADKFSSVSRQGLKHGRQQTTQRACVW